MKNALKDVIFMAAILAIIIGILVGAAFLISNHTEKKGRHNFENEISEYTTIVVNGEEYNIADITDIDYDDLGYSNDTMTIELDDGTKIHFLAGCYTLKGKK